jgi:hypothetical protein
MSTDWKPGYRIWSMPKFGEFFFDADFDLYRVNVDGSITCQKTHDPKAMARPPFYKAEKKMNSKVSKRYLAVSRQLVFVNEYVEVSIDTYTNSGNVVAKIVHMNFRQRVGMLEPNTDAFVPAELFHQEFEPEEDWIPWVRSMILSRVAGLEQRAGRIGPEIQTHKKTLESMEGWTECMNTEP